MRKERKAFIVHFVTGLNGFMERLRPVIVASIGNDAK
jgi:hypothetical protein